MPLLIVAIAAVYSVGVLYYLSRMPSLVGVFWFFTHVPFSQGSDFRQCLYGLRDMRLEPTDAPEGIKLTDQGISFVLDTQEPVVETANNEYNSTYRIGEDKMIMLQTYEPYVESADWLKWIGDAAPSYTYRYRDMKARRLFEKATGKSPDSEYVCEEAIWDATIWDLSLFDDDKNKGVLNLLVMKIPGSPPDAEHYRFSNGYVTGILLRREGVNVLTFFPSDDLDTRCHISIVGSFTPVETETILRTLTLDKETLANQEVDIP